jgi:serine/threonine protein kinase
MHFVLVHGVQGFWAPEQLDKSKTYKTEPDFWTLGVCAFHWACGKLPFHAKEADEVKELVKKGDHTF